MAPAKRDLLDVLSDVKTRVHDKLGIVDFPMPQFIIIGSQSVGKSRLIEAMAGEQFNFISGTLGSRRPTVLEFRNVEGEGLSKWSTRDPATNQWVHKPTPEVMHFVGQAHESCGLNVSKEPIYVRIESSQCVDMQIVDLPGYRGYASDDAAKRLADDIEALNASFLNDPRNVILCVEEAGDAANLSSLSRVREIDREYKRTILIRSKLDKYYDDLATDNVQKWLEGSGDLPKNLKKFALTLPHWRDGVAAPKPLAQMREECASEDLNKLASLGASTRYLRTVGFGSFSQYMETRTERMFVEAIGPVLTKLRDLEHSLSMRGEELTDELETSDPAQVLSTVRACGMTFANCLEHVMGGVIRSSTHRMTLDEELRAFDDYHKRMGDSADFESRACSDLQTREDYISCLQDFVKVPSFDVSINGGAQFTRLMFEVETYLRFSELGGDGTKKKDVLQAFGISMGSVTWNDVIVKLLNHDGHLPLQRRVAYVGERVKWFFLMQKEPILEFMQNLKGSPDEKLYSLLYTKHAKLIEGNQTIKKLIFDTFDAVLDRQLRCFLELFGSSLRATFANPWVFLKKTTADFDDDDDLCLATLEDTMARIPREMQSRTGIERELAVEVNEVPLEPHKIDEAVDSVELLVHKVYSQIRSTVCDQVELFCESFFKLPLLRRLEEDMNKIELSDVYKAGMESRRARLDLESKANAHGLKEVRDCLNILSNFQLRTMAAAQI